MPEITSKTVHTFSEEQTDFSTFIISLKDNQSISGRAPAVSDLTISNQHPFYFKKSKFGRICLGRREHPGFSGTKPALQGRKTASLTNFTNFIRWSHSLLY